MSADNYIYVRRGTRNLPSGVPMPGWFVTMESASADEPRPIRDSDVFFPSYTRAWEEARTWEHRLSIEGYPVEYGITSDPDTDVKPQKAQDRQEITNVVNMVVEQEQGKLWQEFWKRHDEVHGSIMSGCFACVWGGVANAE